MTVQNEPNTVDETIAPAAPDAPEAEALEADAPAGDDSQPAAGKKKSRFWQRGKKPVTDQQAPVGPLSAEEFLKAQRLYEQQQHEQQLRAAQEAYLQKSSFFRETWGQVDTTTDDFAYGVQIITDISPNQKGKNDHLNLKTVNGTELCWMKTSQETKDGIVTTEFIGLTKGQAQKTPLNDQIAEDIISIYKARHGNKPITLIGSSDEKDILWLAAMKGGLTVSNHFPSAEFKAKWEAMQTQEFGVEAAAKGDAPTAEAVSEPQAEAHGASTAETDTAEEPNADKITSAPNSAFTGGLVKGHAEPASRNRFTAIEAALTEERLATFDEEGLKALGKTIDEECKKGLPAKGTPEYESLTRIVTSIDARQKEIEAQKKPPSSFMQEAPATPTPPAAGPHPKPGHREP